MSILTLRGIGRLSTPRFDRPLPRRPRAFSHTSVLRSSLRDQSALEGETRILRGTISLVDRDGPLAIPTGFRIWVKGSRGLRRTRLWLDATQ